MNYIKTTLRTAVALCCGALLATACSSNEEEPSTPTSASGTLEISLNPATRVGLSDDRAPRFEWDGAPETLYLFFKATDGSNKTAVARGTLNIPAGWKASSGGNITMTVEKPATFAGVRSYQVSGAIGVERMEADGECIVTPPAAIVNDKYKIPFYFPLTTVKVGSNKDNLSANFKRYGSLIRVPMSKRADATDPVTFSNMQVITGGLFSIEGSFNVNTTTYPKYTAKDKYIVEKDYSLSGFSTAGEDTIAYVWIKPNSELSFAADKIDEDSVHRVDINIDNTLTTRAEGYWHAHSVRTAVIKDTLSYTMTTKYNVSSLIISQNLYVSDIYGGYIEIYNPTDMTIPLETFTLYDRKNKLRMYLAGSQSSLVKCVNNQVQAGQSAPTEIKPKEIIVYSTYPTRSILAYSPLFFSDHDKCVFYRDTKHQKTTAALAFMGQIYGRIELQNDGMVVDQSRNGPSALYNTIREPNYNMPNPKWSRYEWYLGRNEIPEAQRSPNTNVNATSQYWTDVWNGQLGIR